MDKQFESTSVSKIKISELTPTQKFVFEKAIKKADENKAIHIIKQGGVNYILDGNHALAKAHLNGSKFMNAKIIQID